MGGCKKLKVEIYWDRQRHEGCNGVLPWRMKVGSMCCPAWVALLSLSGSNTRKLKGTSEGQGVGRKIGSTKPALLQETLSQKSRKIESFV